MHKRISLVVQVGLASGIFFVIFAILLSQLINRFVSENFRSQTVRLTSSFLEKQVDNFLDPKDFEPVFRTGLIYDVQGKLDEALNKYNEALKLKPDLKDAIFRIATIYYKKEKYDNAVKKYEEVLKIDPNNSDSHLNLGSIYDNKLNSNEKAIYHYKEFLRLNPNYKDADVIKVRIDQLEPSKKQ